MKRTTLKHWKELRNQTEKIVGARKVKSTTKSWPLELINQGSERLNNNHRAYIGCGCDVHHFHTCNGCVVWSSCGTPKTGNKRCSDRGSHVGTLSGASHLPGDNHFAWLPLYIDCTLEKHGLRGFIPGSVLAAAECSYVYHFCIPHVSIGPYYARGDLYCL